MQVQVNSNQIQSSQRFQEWVSATIEDQLEHFDDFLTRVEVHVTDDNAHKAGASDKRCQIEMRPKGHQALSVTHKAESLVLAVNGAAEKARHALEHLTGKLSARVVPPRHLDDPLNHEASQEVKDALLQEEFLERQQQLDNS